MERFVWGCFIIEAKWGLTAMWMTCFTTRSLHSSLPTFLPTSLPPSLHHQSFPFSPSSWSCKSYFSSYSTSREPTIGWTVSIWQHCCVAKATTLMTELFGGAVQWVQHNSDMMGCYQTKLQACLFFCDFKHTNLMTMIFLNTTSFQNQEYLQFIYYQLKLKLLLLIGLWAAEGLNGAPLLLLLATSATINKASFHC